MLKILLIIGCMLSIHASEQKEISLEEFDNSLNSEDSQVDLLSSVASTDYWDAQTSSISYAEFLHQISPADTYADHWNSLTPEQQTAIYEKNS